ncbi:8449_t:CDS:2, partial [Ambispora gerdemannii]
HSTNKSISTLDSFIARPLFKNDKYTFEKLLICATVSADHRVLEGRILNDESKALQVEMKQKLQNNSVSVTLTFNGWTNVINQNILGSVFIISE